MITDAQIRTYMRDNLCDHIDRYTDEVNCTTLAEDAADHFNLYEPAAYNVNDLIPETRLFELSLEIADEYESAPY